MNKLNSYVKTAAGLMMVVALVLVFGNTGNAGISANDNAGVSISAEKRAPLAILTSSKFESSTRSACGAGKCGAGKCGGSDKKAAVKGEAKDTKNVAKEVKRGQMRRR